MGRESGDDEGREVTRRSNLPGFPSWNFVTFVVKSCALGMTRYSRPTPSASATRLM